MTLLVWPPASVNITGGATEASLLNVLSAVDGVEALLGTSNSNTNNTTQAIVATNNLLTTTNNLLTAGNAILTAPVGIERIAVGTPYYRDYSSSNLAAGAWTQIVASTSARIRKLDIFDSSGSVVMVGIGGAGAEVEVLRITPGGNGAIELTIPIASRISIQSVTGTLSVGLLVINMFS